jgi:hypothetical protein
MYPSSLPHKYSFNNQLSWVWWFIAVIPAFRRLKQENFEFKISMGYIVRLYFKKEKKIS